MPSRLTCLVGYQLEIGKVCQCLVLFNSDVPNYQSTNQIMSQHWLVSERKLPRRERVEERYCY